MKRHIYIKCINKFQLKGTHTHHAIYKMSAAVRNQQAGLHKWKGQQNNIIHYYSQIVLIASFGNISLNFCLI